MTFIMSSYKERFMEAIKIIKLINGDDIVSTLNDLNEEANAILADAIAQ